MKLGAVQYCLGKPDEVFDRAKALGLDGVELGFGQPDDMTANVERRAKTRDTSDHSGVAIPSLMLGVLNQGGWASDDVAVRDAATKVVLGGLDAAFDLGAKVVLVPFFYKAHPVDGTAVERLIEHFRELAPEAKGRGITLAYEGQLPALELRAMLERIDSDAVGCYYDVGNAVWLGHDPLAEIDLLRERIVQVHVKEFGEKLNDRPLGEGSVPVAEAMERLRGIGYDDWVVLETGTFGDPEGATRRQLEYLKQFV